MSSKIFFQDLFSKSAGEMLSGLDVLRTLNWNTIENFKFFKEIKDIKSVALLFGNGIAWEIENDEFVESTEVFDLFGVGNFVVANVEFH